MTAAKRNKYVSNVVLKPLVNNADRRPNPAVADAQDSGGFELNSLGSPLP